MGRVKHNRATRLRHYREAAHIGDQRIVAKRGSALAKQEIVFRLPRFARGSFRLLDNIGHIARRHKLRFFDVDRFACGGNCSDEIGLAREEGGRLENVDNLGHGLGLRRFVHVGQHGQSGLGAHLFKNTQPFFQTRPTERRAGGAVGLIKRALEDKQDAQALGDLGELTRHVQ